MRATLAACWLFVFSVPRPELRESEVHGDADEVLVPVVGSLERAPLREAPGSLARRACEVDPSRSAPASRRETRPAWRRRPSPHRSARESNVVSSDEAGPPTWKWSMTRNAMHRRGCLLPGATPGPTCPGREGALSRRWSADIARARPLRACASGPASRRSPSLPRARTRIAVWVERGCARPPFLDHRTVGRIYERRARLDAAGLEEGDEERDLVLAIAITTREHRGRIRRPAPGDPHLDADVSDLILNEAQRPKRELLRRTTVSLRLLDPVKHGGIGLAVREELRPPLSYVSPRRELRHLRPRDAVDRRRRVFLEREGGDVAQVPDVFARGADVLSLRHDHARPIEAVERDMDGAAPGCNQAPV